MKKVNRFCVTVDTGAGFAGPFVVVYGEGLALKRRGFPRKWRSLFNAAWRNYAGMKVVKVKDGRLVK